MDVIGFIIINALLISLIQWLATTWLKTRLEASIRHEYDVALAKLRHEYERQMELFRFDQRRRERAAMIAELFAEWVPVKAPEFKRLNKLSFEASLWLPADIVVELSKRLCHAADAKDFKALLVEVRRRLTGEADEVEPGHIIHFQ